MIRVVIGSIIWFGVWFPFTFQFLRTIVIDQAGVKVQCLFYKKYYTWNQFKVIRMEKPHYSDNYGMFFLSEHLVKRKIRDDLMWSMGLHVGYYDFMEKLRQWEIEFEEVLVEYSFEGF